MKAEECDKNEAFDILCFIGFRSDADERYDRRIYQDRAAGAGRSGSVVRYVAAGNGGISADCKWAGRADLRREIQRNAGAMVRK